MNTETKATERPMLFSAPMVRAILDGTKTQTRRVVKPQPAGDIKRGAPGLNQWFDTKYFERPNQRENKGIGTSGFPCPHGQTGDILWCKETWQPEGVAGYERMFPIRYRATQDERVMGHKWRPSIFMPRWASRITLEIVGVRVERLQAISAEDAKAEGVEAMSHGFRDYGKRDLQFGDAISSYCSLWESINGEGSWELNPWVWVVEFKRFPAQAELAAAEAEEVARRPV